MNARLHSVLKYVYAAFLLGSGVKHLYNIYVADPTIMATGYPEPEATAFVLAVLDTKFLLPSSALPNSLQASSCSFRAVNSSGC